MEPAAFCFGTSASPLNSGGWPRCPLCDAGDAVLDSQSYQCVCVCGRWWTHAARPSPWTWATWPSAASTSWWCPQRLLLPLILPLRRGFGTKAQGVPCWPWDAHALKVFKHLANAAATRSGKEPAACYNLPLQELGVTIPAFRARAVLRRRNELSMILPGGAFRSLAGACDSCASFMRDSTEVWAFHLKSVPFRFLFSACLRMPFQCELGCHAGLYFPFLKKMWLQSLFSFFCVSLRLLATAWRQILHWHFDLVYDMASLF